MTKRIAATIALVCFAHAARGQNFTPIFDDVGGNTTLGGHVSDTSIHQLTDAELAAIALLTDTGLLVRTADNTWAIRTITGDSEIVVSNGGGVAGNPMLSIGASIARDSELPVGANPTATVNGTATNGSAGTWMRSDGAPALADPFTPADGVQDFAGGIDVLEDNDLANTTGAETKVAEFTDTFVTGVNEGRFLLKHRRISDAGTGTWTYSTGRLEHNIDGSAAANNWIEFQHPGTTASDNSILFGEGAGGAGVWGGWDNGSFGIGTSAPTFLTEIAHASAPTLALHRTGGATPSGNIILGLGGSDALTYGSAILLQNDQINFQTDSTPTNTTNNLTTRATLTSTGLGIGITPTTPLHVRGVLTVTGDGDGSDFTITEAADETTTLQPGGTAPLVLGSAAAGTDVHVGRNVKFLTSPAKFFTADGSEFMRNTDNSHFEVFSEGYVILQAATGSDVESRGASVTALITDEPAFGGFQVLDGAGLGDQVALIDRYGSALFDGYVSTRGHEYLAVDIISHTITAGEASAGVFTESWAVAGEDKVTAISAVYYDVSEDAAIAGDWTLFDPSFDLDGSTLTVTAQGSSETWVEDDVIRVRIEYME